MSVRELIAPVSTRSMLMVVRHGDYGVYGFRVGTVVPLCSFSIDCSVKNQYYIACVVFKKKKVFNTCWSAITI